MVSIGGNDATGNIDLLTTRGRPTAEALGAVRTRVAEFEARDAAALAAPSVRSMPTRRGHPHRHVHAVIDV
jgi:hypothetical protein